MYEKIAAKDLQYINNPAIIDIRKKDDYQEEHIPRAINIPINYLLGYTRKYLQKDKKYYIYCQFGIKSNRVCQILAAKGYQVREIKDGYEGWLLSK